MTNGHAQQNFREILLTVLINHRALLSVFSSAPVSDAGTMRNLRCLVDSTLATPAPHTAAGGSPGPAPLVCIVDGGKRVAVLHGDGMLQMFDDSGRHVWKLRLSTGKATYVELSHIAELDALFVASLEGTIATVTLPTLGPKGSPAEPPVEEVIGEFDGGLCSATWSADQSLLLIVTPQRRVTVMTTSFQVFAEADIFPASAAAPPDGSAAASDAPVWAGIRVPACWRADSAHFAVLVPLDADSASTVSPLPQQWQVRIFSQDGSLTGHGRHEDGSPVPDL